MFGTNASIGLRAWWRTNPNTAGRVDRVPGSGTGTHVGQALMRRREAMSPAQSLIGQAATAPGARAVVLRRPNSSAGSSIGVRITDRRSW